MTKNRTLFAAAALAAGTVALSLPTSMPAVATPAAVSAAPERHCLPSQDVILRSDYINTTRKATVSLCLETDGKDIKVVSAATDCDTTCVILTATSRWTLKQDGEDVGQTQLGKQLAYKGEGTYSVTADLEVYAKESAEQGGTAEDQTYTAKPTFSGDLSFTTRLAQAPNMSGELTAVDDDNWRLTVTNSGAGAALTTDVSFISRSDVKADDARCKETSGGGLACSLGRMEPSATTEITVTRSGKQLCKSTWVDSTMTKNAPLFRWAIDTNFGQGAVTAGPACT
ncbi:hypothetical protein [Kitasatospora sp. McL0602]|uniref:hypothetical protein n=1 Tax=Kitasatospora sp. McL0602 TaxID=3439530 RepID=UPI003F8ADA07